MNETLALIAEFSIGLAGFSGIVALIGNTNHPIHRFRVMVLLRASFTPGFCALLALLLQHAGLTLENTIRLTSAIFGLVTLTSFARGLQTMTKFDGSSRKTFFRPMTLIHLAGYVINIMLQTLNAFMVTQYAEGILIGGLVHVLLVGATSFIRIVRSVLKNRSEIG